MVAVGGDGTLNEVVNGFFHNGAPIPTTTRLAMVPLGTGGDFRRTLRIPLDSRAAIGVITTGLVRRLDAGCVTYQDHAGGTSVRHFINIADAGLGGEVVNQVTLDNARIKDRPPAGYIGFQDHGLPLWLRNIKVREL